MCGMFRALKVLFSAVKKFVAGVDGSIRSAVFFKNNDLETT